MRVTALPIIFIAVVSPVMSASVAGHLVNNQTVHTISQKSRRFEPSEIYLELNEIVSIQNDDGNFVHDAYVESSEFNFESGDINPGDTAIIAFPTEGDFTVLCGVHPSMKLAVHVRSSSSSETR